MSRAYGIALALLAVLSVGGVTLWFAGIIHKTRNYVYNPRRRRR